MNSSHEPKQQSRYLGKHRGPALIRTVLAAVAAGTIGVSALTAAGATAPSDAPIAAVAETTTRDTEDRADRSHERTDDKNNGDSAKTDEASEADTKTEEEKKTEEKPQEADPVKEEKKPAWVAPSTAKISDVYGPRAWRNGEMHFGLDFAANEGENIVAAAKGVVVQAGWNGGYGNSIIIDHGNGVLTIYGHHSKLKVSVGTYVETGDVIGLAGSTGDVTGPHLHFEVNNNGTMVDPHTWLTARGVDL